MPCHVVAYKRWKGKNSSYGALGNPMKHFLRDVLAGFLASLLAALAAHLMNL